MSTASKLMQCPVCLSCSHISKLDVDAFHVELSGVWMNDRVVATAANEPSDELAVVGTNDVISKATVTNGVVATVAPEAEVTVAVVGEVFVVVVCGVRSSLGCGVNVGVTTIVVHLTQFSRRGYPVATTHSEV